MKYLQKELFFKCFEHSTYNESEDKCLIGYLNQSKTKLKDVVTGQIIESESFGELYQLESLVDLTYERELKGGMMVRSFRDAMAVEKVRSILENRVIDTKQIAKIKKIMNTGIIRSHNESIKRQNEKLEQYAIDEVDRNF